MRNLFLGLILAVCALGSAQSLVELEADAAKGGSNDGLAPLLRVGKIEALVENDQLVSGEDFLRASRLLVTWVADFRTCRLRYELLLTALVMGEPKALKELPEAWDALMVSLGRPLRFDPQGIAKQPLTSLQVDRVPKAVRDVYMDPARRRERAELASDSKEVKSIVEADQADRQKDFSKMTQDDFRQLVLNDQARLKAIESLVTKGRLVSKGDYASASLVMQHSQSFAGYRLAHELAVSSVILGNEELGRWLVAATYDRMLNAVGHDQRFGTQYLAIGLRRTDEAGFNDRQRRAFRCPALAEARARQF